MASTKEIDCQIFVQILAWPIIAILQIFQSPDYVLLDL